MKQSTEYDCPSFDFQGAPPGLGGPAGGASQICRRDPCRAGGDIYARRFIDATG